LATAGCPAVRAGCLAGAGAVAGAGERFSPSAEEQAGGFEGGVRARFAHDVVVASPSARG